MKSITKPLAFAFASLLSHDVMAAEPFPFPDPYTISVAGTISRVTHVVAPSDYGRYGFGWASIELSSGTASGYAIVVLCTIGATHERCGSDTRYHLNQATLLNQLQMMQTAQSAGRRIYIPGHSTSSSSYYSYAGVITFYD